jgi:kynureninase
VDAIDTAEDEAAGLDATDPQPTRRASFAVPPWPGGRHEEWAYLAGNSLGLMPRAARVAVEEELDAWGRHGVEAWFDADAPWLETTGQLRRPLAALVGAAPEEVVVMNALTVNLHLLAATFYRPDTARYAIVIEDNAFPSDSYAVQSQAAWHGHDPATAVVRLPPRDGEHTLRTEDVVEAIEREAPRLALVLLGAVNYLTGEALDLEAITAATRAAGAVSGWDLAHAVGNVPVALHDAGADFAVWCTYKYLNGGPGAPGGAFVHARHFAGRDPHRLAGWWGVDAGERFRMEPGFAAAAGADGWAASTPPILSTAPLAASLALFDEAGLPELRERSVRLTGYLEALLDGVAARRRLEVITPRDPARRGCQLSVAVDGARELAGRLRDEHGVVGDFREPDVLRLAPTPLYNTFHDCWRAAAALDEVLEPR